MSQRAVSMQDSVRKSTDSSPFTSQGNWSNELIDAVLCGVQNLLGSNLTRPETAYQDITAVV